VPRLLTDLSELFLLPEEPSDLKRVEKVVWQTAIRLSVRTIQIRFHTLAGRGPLDCGQTIYVGWGRKYLHNGDRAMNHLPRIRQLKGVGS
jgi:hypothetical protein